MSRPGIVTLLAVLQFIGAAVSLLAAVVMMAATAVAYGRNEGQPVGVMLVLLFGAVGVAELVCGIGLLKLKSYGRTLQLVFTWVGLLGFPIGTVISGLILIYLNKPGIKVLFSGRPASQLTPDDWAHVVAVGHSRAAQWLIGAIVVLVLVVPILGVVAAIAIPGLVRARMSGNEASAIGSLRAINSAQAAFSVSCAKGLYAVTLGDLVKPPSGDRQGFISDDLWKNGVTKSGYVISVAKDAAPGVTDAGAAASTCNGAEPVTLDSTGTRYFATDARGTIFSSRFPITNPITESRTGRSRPVTERPDKGGESCSDGGWPVRFVTGAKTRSRSWWPARTCTSATAARLRSSGSWMIPSCAPRRPRSGRRRLRSRESFDAGGVAGSPDRASAGRSRTR